MTDASRLYAIHRRRRHTALTRRRRQNVGGTVGKRRTRARLGAAAELVAPLGCVTGSARYLFLIRPDGGGGDGDDGGGDVGQVKCDAIGSADTLRIRLYCVNVHEKNMIFFFADGVRLVSYRKQHGRS